MSPEAPKPTPCPICKKPADPEAKAYPFCSDRCKTIDLAKWISGNYVISRPIEEKDLEDQD